MFLAYLSANLVRLLAANIRVLRLLHMPSGGAGDLQFLWIVGGEGKALCQVRIPLSDDGTPSAERMMKGGSLSRWRFKKLLVRPERRGFKASNGLGESF
jgi:hypothetical protein